MSIKKKQRYVLSLIGAMMLATLSVTGCGGSVNVNSNKTGEISEAPESGSEDETEVGSENEPEEAPDTAIAADMEEHTVHLNSKATRGAGYISVNETFTDQKGNQYNLFMNGLKDENKDAMIEALSLYYDADSEDGLGEGMGMIAAHRESGWDVFDTTDMEQLDAMLMDPANGYILSVNAGKTIEMDSSGIFQPAQ